jgi:hypothetical protein
MLIEFGNEWILNQSYGFKVFNNLKPQNPKQVMNIVDALSYAPKLKVMRTTWAFNKKLIQCSPKLNWET